MEEKIIKILTPTVISSTQTTFKMIRRMPLMWHVRYGTIKQYGKDKLSAKTNMPG